ncbi:cytochrome c oxidase subunit 2 [Sinobacterium caligoides]|uniref:cytochrome-c oxidase n=1 Tax=Sinobacterium caligoides TaxID=933926 RepID=A0A3N2DMU9_9GAMM|nr:c-type cytochrome [Sinobacterium caligoides]ROS00979.1 cytochrome c oxidase subunit 2 [Sinobacterium caligoides]
MAIAIVILLLVFVSLIFHYLSPWWLTPIASNWGAIDDTINITLWVTGVVFVAVNCFLAYVVYKFRFNKARRSHYEPENKKLEGWLTVITALGIAVMLAPGLWVWQQFVSVPKEAKVVEALGQQWHWGFRLPGKDGLLGKTAIAFIDESNPFGIDEEDANGQDDVLILSNELHVLLGQPVKVLLRSKDVLHNFAVPQFRVKMDLVPGISTYLWFTPTRLGRFELLCEELCGMAHYTMRGHIVVDSEEGYRRWLSEQPTFAQYRRQVFAERDADREKGQLIYAACMACHGERGEGNPALMAPQLAGQSVAYLKRQLRYYRQHIRGNDERDSYGRQMAAMAAILTAEKDINDVSAYISSLPTQAAVLHSPGDIAKGRSLFRNCSDCHGRTGEGRVALRAPRLSGQHGDYLKRQLLHFKNGVRGSQEGDVFGHQMVLMAQTLRTIESINDVVAYITTLPVVTKDEDVFSVQQSRKKVVLLPNDAVNVGEVR